MSFIIQARGLPWWLTGKESTCQCRRHGFHPWSRKDPWRRKWQPTLVFLPEEPHRQMFLSGEPHGQRSPEGYSPWGQKKNQTQLSGWTTITTRNSSQIIYLHLVSVYDMHNVSTQHCFRYYRWNSSLTINHTLPLWLLIFLKEDPMVDAYLGSSYCVCQTVCVPMASV